MFLKFFDICYNKHGIEHKNLLLGWRNFDPVTKLEDLPKQMNNFFSK